MEKENLVYFELNDWFSGRDYPDEEPFSTWIDDKNTISNDEWCKENELVVVYGNYDMSLNWLIAAKEDWVRLNCPKLLSDDSHPYIVLRHSAAGTQEIEETMKYSQFLRFPDEEGIVRGRFGWELPEYSEENYGVHYHEDDYDWDEDELEEDED